MNKKKKVVYKEGYPANTPWRNKAQIIELLQQSQSVVFVINAGKYEDDKEFLTIKIDEIQ